ncbi:Universal stress protein family protein [Poseidonocella pacifica]|uniref:Universal stress protein family protein n=1 Tax=Poseidonocella pacifica TaxID=871651 RepID=A0A1I0XIP3_9RHOB|nr:universal stress protein [Poseidonocella pacifica]SFB00774.1 Universal stress protein family protein [Poseidonocella pacifica]
MAYKTIFSALAHESALERTIAQAEALAGQWDAHLEVLCIGLDRIQSGYYDVGANALILQDAIKKATEDAEALSVKVDERLRGAALRWSSDTAVANVSDMVRPVAGRARFSDLAVMSQPQGGRAEGEAEALIESALFQGQCPVMVVPESGAPIVAPRRILIGWDESREALSAVRAALPMLKSAGQATIAVIDPPRHGPERSDPGGLLSQFLARHGIRCEIDVLARTMPRIADVLIQRAVDMDAEMVVIGAYGHSRFREAILGGATRTMLEEAPMPVFMAH